MGKLAYEPYIDIAQEHSMDDLDELAGAVSKNSEYGVF